MQNFAIITDAAAALLLEQTRELNIKVVPMTVHIGDKEFKHSPEEKEMKMKDFYEQLRTGISSGTAAVNPGDWAQAMEEELQAGKDVLAIAFTSALSSTYENARMAAEELRERYADRKLVVIDSLCADFGQGMYVCMAAKKRDEGLSIEETAAYLEEIKLNICHWFTVDDLHHLRRGGRISATTAVVGSALGIKPVLHVDDEGRLINVSKARGRKKSLSALVDKAVETAIEPEKQTMFICHADCPEDVEYVISQLKSRCNVPEVIVNFTAPVAGAHAGPGTLALFFVGKKR